MRRLLEFTTEVIYLNRKEKVSRTGRKYTIVRFLDSQWKSFDCLADDDVVIPYNMKQFDRVEVTFRLETGRFMKLYITNFERIAFDD